MLAYLRGLLTPDYPNGTASVLRENIILKSIDLEMTSKYMEHLFNLQSMFSSFLENRQKVYSRLIKDAEVLTYYKFGNPCIAQKKNSTIDDLAEMYKVFKSTGILDKMGEL